MYFPWVCTPSSHFHMSKKASKQSTSTTATTCTLSWCFFFLSPAPCQHWQRATCSFCSILLAKGREGRRMKTFLVLLSLLKGHAKTRLVSPEVTVTKLPTFPYSLALFHCLLSRHLIGLWVYFAFSTDISSIRLLYILAYRLTHMIYCSHP